MAAPTGKLKYAYQTIANMEAIITKQKEEIKTAQIVALEKLLSEAKDNVQTYCRCETLGRYDEFIEAFIVRLKND